ncbi:hypothetical protein SAMN05443144_11558 [Fodinibius roseus]|uniref:Uncharacterized protein n=1 Tax=Fodinibius roseus TaxID=1194090 RepID=A0A1M5FKD7_9BACT|nr:hypothetical protein SAMN05443144_11558 [Fodinibius roseus]
MITRIWHGVVPLEKAEHYYDYLQATGLQEYRNSISEIIRKNRIFSVVCSCYV